MLTHLHIRDFALVEKLDIELQAGLTAITGETGAGKSIMLDALGLTLGERTDSSKIKNGAERADIHASFDISRLQFARKWLKDHDLDQNDECILRRVITVEGRSRAYINGQTVPLQQLRALGEQLIDIHSQHEHQSLLSSTTHRRLLDEFGKMVEPVETIKSLHAEWSELETQLSKAREHSDEINARFQLLSYQVGELDQLDLHAGELAALEREHKILANANSTNEHCQAIAEICRGDDVGLVDRIHQAIRLCDSIEEKPEHLSNIHTLLQNALINIEETQADIERFLDSQEQDPERLFEVEQRLDSIYDISHKHRVGAEDIVELHQRLAEELSQLSSGDQLITSLEEQLAEKYREYDAVAQVLTSKRQKAALKLAAAVNNKFKQLAMDRAKLTVDLCVLDKPSRYGNEKVEFLISTNPGQAPLPLQKIASGGELSRISLAIQVVTAQCCPTPTLVFDEVDVGIGGTTGDEVGNMLRELGEQGQIFCVTHLAQVASKAHHHYLIEKHVTKNEARTSLTHLNKQERVIEIARMMGGPVDSKQSIAHAKTMLAEG